MFLQLFETMVEFLEQNGVLVALILAITEYLKRWFIEFHWYKGWYSTIIAFVLGYLMAIPPTLFAGINWWEYVAHGFGLGLVATGLYKVGTAITRH